MAAPGAGSEGGSAEASYTGGRFTNGFEHSNRFLVSECMHADPMAALAQLGNSYDRRDYVLVYT